MQTFPSSVHAAPLACFASAGQATLVPVQASAASHSPAATRQTVVVGSRTSAGQLVLVPVHVSIGSQMPADARHVVPPFPAACWQVSLLPSQRSVVQTFPSSVHAVPLACFASPGHAAFVPVQLSATSHSPAVARQTVVVGRKLSAGQLTLVPVHVSATSHTPAAARHAVVVGSNASAGHALLVPVQVSAGSQMPADARHVVPPFPAAC